MTRDLSEDALAESFVDYWWKYDTLFLWIESQHTWYVSELDADRKPVWAANKGFEFMRMVRDHIRTIAEELVGDKSKLRSLATLRAVTELLKIDYSGTEADLEPGELARQIEWKIWLRDLRPEREQPAQTQTQTQTPRLPPRQPQFSPLPSAEEVKTRIATAADAFARTPRVR